MYEKGPLQMNEQFNLKHIRIKLVTIDIFPKLSNQIIDIAVCFFKYTVVKQILSSSDRPRGHNQRGSDTFSKQFFIFKRR